MMMDLETEANHAFTLPSETKDQASRNPSPKVHNMDCSSPCAINNTGGVGNMAGNAEGSKDSEEPVASSMIAWMMGSRELEPEPSLTKESAVVEAQNPQQMELNDTAGDAKEAVDVPKTEDTEAKDWKSIIVSRPLLISIGEFDFQHFKNRWGDDAGYNIVEVLTGSEKTLDDFNKEEALRGDAVGEKRHLQEHQTKGEVSETWIQRIRIHSPIILHYLQAAMRAPIWSTEHPRVFFKPFKALIHYHPDMKRALEKLERKYAGKSLHTSGPQMNDKVLLEADQGTPFAEEIDHADQASNPENVLPAMGTSENTDKPTQPDDCDLRAEIKNTGLLRGSLPAEEDEHDDMHSGVTALKHLRCYVDFMDKRIMPLNEMFNGSSRTMVRFDDLWFLFKVGDVIYSPVNTASRDTPRTKQNRTKRGMYQTAFMLFFKGVSVIDNTEPDDLRIRDRAMTLWCYYIDHDGDSYGPVKHKLVIEAYSGLKDIRDLVAYPIRFATNAEKLMTELKDQGQRFRSFMKEKHVSCEGWTLTTPPLGVHERSEEGTTDHVESDVIIDFAEAMRRQPSWKHEFEAPLTTDNFDDWSQGVDAMSICHWPNASEGRKVDEAWFRIEEYTQRDDDTEEQIKKAGIEANAFLQAFSDGIVTTLDGIDEDINDLLLPRRFIVYVLRQRRFAMVETLSLSLIPTQLTIFDDLRIDSNHKLIVQSLVADHFEKRAVQRQQPFSGFMNQDLVRGKGSGLFILLHGVPGVGKTATAEAVAQANNKPLFTITCGDLGLTPEAVDSKLNEVFRLAHLWDCVLLLDEADIFLAKRDTFNLKRNALVSVFLRVLEYYSGILFLTTNRVGILDEAFKSRIHISLYYEPLSRHQTIEIFRVNIRKLRAIEDEKQQQLKGTFAEKPRLVIKAKRIIEYAQRYFDEQEDAPHLRWNGRQIRNAFQIASSLAHYNIRQASLSQLDLGLDSGEQVACPVLDETQFDKVAEAIERFGNYMDHTRAMTDADQARLDTTRADDIRNHDLTPRKRVYNTFGAPPTASGGHERRRPAEASNRARRTQAMSSHEIEQISGRTAQRISRGQRDTQSSRGMGLGERSANNPVDSRQRLAAGSRAYQTTSRRNQQPHMDEPYSEEEEYEEEKDETPRFDEKRASTMSLEEDFDDVGEAYGRDNRSRVVDDDYDD